MGKIKLFPVPEYSSKQFGPRGAPGTMHRHLPRPQQIRQNSLILEQYRGVFERIYIFSPSIAVDDGWIPVKKYIEEELGVNTEREQAYWEDWDEPALRRIIQQQRKITGARTNRSRTCLLSRLLQSASQSRLQQRHRRHRLKRRRLSSQESSSAG